MPVYAYLAKKGTETVRGELEAGAEDAAIRELERMGYLPVRVDLKGTPAASAGARPPAGRSAGARQAQEFARQLSGLLKAKTPLLRALEVLERETRHAAMKSVIADVKSRVKDGSRLSAALAPHGCFPPVYVSLIAAGEKNGLLAEILADLVEWIDREQETLSRFRSAMAYPCLMAVVGAASVAYMMLSVLPKLVSIYEMSGQSLPVSTRALMAASSFLRRWWHASAAAAALLTLWFARSGGWRRIQPLLSAVGLRTPFLGRYLLARSLSRFFRTLGLLLASGVEIRESIRASIPVVGNAELERSLSSLETDVAGGQPVASSLGRSRLVPGYALSLVSVGEEAGQLAQALLGAAKVYEKETEERLRVFGSLIEPLLILAVGLAVGFIVFAMLSPVFQFNLQ